MFKHRSLPVARLILLITLGLSALLLLPGQIAAQTVSAEPTQITVAGTRGDQMDRTLLLSVTSPITGVQVLILDMPRTDDAAALPTGAIVIGEITSTLAAGEFVVVPLRFDLRDGKSGEYNGSLRITYFADSFPGAVTVPLKVSIKDQPWGPFLTLLFGVAAATIISLYRARYQPVDEARVRVGKLRTRLNAEQEQMNGAFVRAITDQLQRAEYLLQSQKLDEGRPAVETAEQLMDRWFSNRSQWADLLAFEQRITARLDELNASPDFRRAMEKRIKEIDEQVLTMAPIDLQQQLETVANEIDTYLDLKTDCDNLVALQHAKAALIDDPTKQRIAAIQKRLANLSSAQSDPALVQDTQALISEVQSLQAPRSATLRDSTTAPVAPEVALKQADKIGKSPVLVLPTMSPTTRAQWEKLTAQLDRFFPAWRLASFQFASYAIAIIFLAGTGFNELYLNKATFGAQPWSDYLALLVWGFGSETSRASITGLARNLGVQTPDQQQGQNL